MINARLPALQSHQLSLKGSRVGLQVTAINTWPQASARLLSAAHTNPLSPIVPLWPTINTQLELRRTPFKKCCLVGSIQYPFSKNKIKQTKPQHVNIATKQAEESPCPALPGASQDPTKCHPRDSTTVPSQGWAVSLPWRNPRGILRKGTSTASDASCLLPSHLREWSLNPTPHAAHSDGSGCDASPARPHTMGPTAGPCLTATTCRSLTTPLKS